MGILQYDWFDFIHICLFEIDEAKVSNLYDIS